MKINIEDPTLLLKQGIYMIKNLVNNKVYIGSTNKTFIGRWKKHFRMLKGNYHYNKHLQFAWNKYNDSVFEFSIIKVLDDNILNEEKAYIEQYNATSREYGYNDTINPTISPSLQLSTQKKISATLKEGYKSGRINISTSTFKPGIIPWNKGQTFTNINSRIAKRKLLQTINVYDINMNYLGNWGTAPDLSDYSLTTKDILQVDLFPLGINRACISFKPYKGYNFRYAPLTSNS